MARWTCTSRIVISCDTYYYGLANELGIDDISNFISQFGFGKRTGIDIEGESVGMLPSQEWKMRRFKQKWFAGDTISVGIGQGYMIATPLQLAHATAAIAANGTVYRPRLVQHVQDSRTSQLQSVAPHVARARLRRSPSICSGCRRRWSTSPSPGHGGARRCRRALYVRRQDRHRAGGRRCAGSYVERRVHERHRDHALFIAYAPAENPTIALAVLVENGGHGGATAAPIARKVFDYYLLGKEPEPLKRDKVEHDDTSD